MPQISTFFRQGDVISAHVMLLQIKTGQYSVQPPPGLGKQWVDILGSIDGTQHACHLATILSNKLFCCLAHLPCICSCPVQQNWIPLLTVLSCHGPWQWGLTFIYHCRRRLKIPTYELLIVFHECFCRAVLCTMCIYVASSSFVTLMVMLFPKYRKYNGEWNAVGENPSINVLGRFESSSNNLRHGTVLQSGSNLGAKFYVDIKKYFDSWCNHYLAVGARAVDTDKSLDKMSFPRILESAHFKHIWKWSKWSVGGTIWRVHIWLHFL